VTVTAATQINNKIRTNFFLEPEEPGPLRKQAKIKINLPYRTRVTVIITNVYGKVVDKMISSIHNAGCYELEFSSEELPRGTYFCHVIADNFSESKEMELTK
jgi:hypothetical protein